MLLPASATAALVALVVCLAGWGSWAVLFKAAKKARFEYFAYDFSWGVALTAVVAAFTLGSWDSSELTFQDNFLLTGLRKMAWVVAAGLVFNLANILLLGSVAVSGMAVGFPIAFGMAWAVVSAATYFLLPDVNPALAFGGSAVLLCAVLAGAAAYHWFQQEREFRAAEAFKVDPRGRPAPPKFSSAKALALAGLAGVFFSLYFPLIEQGTSGESGVSAYGAALLMAGGIFGSSIVYVPFFLNFPVKGKPVTVRQYFKVEGKHHLLGVLGGAVWCAGLLGGLVALDGAARLAPMVETGLLRGAPLLAALWGILVWGEYKLASTRVQAMLGAMMVLMLVGIGLMAVAPR